MWAGITSLPSFKASFITSKTLFSVPGLESPKLARQTPILIRKSFTSSWLSVVSKSISKWVPVSPQVTSTPGKKTKPRSKANLLYSSILFPELWSVRATHSNPFLIHSSIHSSAVTLSLFLKQTLSGECRCRSVLNHLFPAIFILRLILFLI